MTLALEPVGAPSGARAVDVYDRVGFQALEDEWDALVAEVDDQAFYRHAFVRTWLDAFGGDLRVVTLRGPDDRLDAVLPVVLGRARMYGLPVRVLQPAANVHSCRFDLVARDPEAAAGTLWQEIAALPWDVVRLGDVPEGGAAHHLLEAARAAGFPTGRQDTIASPWLALPTRFEDLGLKSKFRQNLRRRRRLLEKMGEVDLVRVTGGPEIEPVLEAGLVLEEAGWKGRSGTAIAQEAAVRDFYVRLAHEMAARGRLALSLLRVDGRPVAFHYALEHAGRYLLLKIAYDESEDVSRCSPGQLLMHDVLRSCCERGLSELDFLGPDMGWKRDWTQDVRPHAQLRIYRDTAVGRTLARAEGEWVPNLKDVVKRWMP